jgi:hypothetical protein
MSQFQFNTGTVQGEHGEAEALPKGIYTAAITGVEEQKENEKGTRQLLITWTVADGEHQGRTVRNYVTFHCPTSADAQNIGLRFLKNICQSIGKPAVNDTNDFLGISHVIKVDTAKPKQGSDKTYPEVKMTYPKGGAPDTAAAPPPAGQPPPPAKRPWER